MGQNVEFNIHQGCMEIRLSGYLAWLNVGLEKWLWEHTVSMQNDYSWFTVNPFKKKCDFL